MVRKAVLIGINYYDSDAELFGCINDVTQMKNMLVDAYGYAESNIVVLRDDKNDPTVRPTARNIVSNLVTALRGNNDEVWVHFSGHGSQVRDTNSDERDRKDEVIVPCDYKTAGIITDDLLFRILNGTKAKVMLTMDCCNSGSNWDLPFRIERIGNSRYRRYIENRNYRSIRNRNIYMMSGSLDYQTAADSYNEDLDMHMGAFTKSLMKALRNLNHNGSILKVFNEVNKLLSEKGYSQKSTLSTTNYFPRFTFKKQYSNTNVPVTKKGIRRNGYRIFRRTLMSDIIGK